METNAEKTTVEKVTINLRKADAWDLKVDSRHLKMGQPLWIKSSITGLFDNAPHIISDRSDPAELASWLQNDMLYVPVSSLE